MHRALDDRRNRDQAVADARVSRIVRIQNISRMVLLAKADCLVIREPHAPPAKAGSRNAIVRLTQQVKPQQQKNAVAVA
jgi:hypothetical protein